MENVDKKATRIIAGFDLADDLTVQDIVDTINHKSKFKLYPQIFFSHGRSEHSDPKSGIIVFRDNLLERETAETVVDLKRASDIDFALVCETWH